MTRTRQCPRAARAAWSLVIAADRTAGVCASPALTSFADGTQRWHHGGRAVHLRMKVKESVGVASPAARMSLATPRVRRPVEVERGHLGYRPSGSWCSLDTVIAWALEGRASSLCGLGAVRRAQRSRRRSSAGRKVCEGRREAACHAGCGEASSPASKARRPLRPCSAGSIKEPTVEETQ